MPVGGQEGCTTTSTANAISIDVVHRHVRHHLGRRCHATGAIDNNDDDHHQDEAHDGDEHVGLVPLRRYHLSHHSVALFRQLVLAVETIALAIAQLAERQAISILSATKLVLAAAHFIESIETVLDIVADQSIVQASHLTIAPRKTHKLVRKAILRAVLFVRFIETVGCAIATPGAIDAGAGGAAKLIGATFFRLHTLATIEAEEQLVRASTMHLVVGVVEQTHVRAVSVVDLRENDKDVSRGTKAKTTELSSFHFRNRLLI